tara:strand:- start:383 stop:580 length:198 start_codon:yes stop_codon:yes gene_type:complete
MEKSIYRVDFETVAKLWVTVVAGSEDEAAWLVEEFSPQVDWGDTTLSDLGEHDITVLECDYKGSN